MIFRGSGRDAIRCSLLLLTTQRCIKLARNPIWLRLEAAPSRGAKRKSTVKIDQLPQGSLPPLETTEANGSGRTYPRTMQQHLDSMRSHPDCVILTRVGDFYELYFDQVAQFAPLLNLKQAQKGSVPMAGFQYLSLDRYLKMLVFDLGQKVALNDQIKPPDGSPYLWERRITRIITAGTLVDESFVDQYNNSYLLAVHLDTDILPSLEQMPQDKDYMPDISNPKIGLSWVDLSSGEFNTQAGVLSTLQTTVARIAPREVVLDSAFSALSMVTIQKLLGDEHFAIHFHQHSGHISGIEDWSLALEQPLSPEDSKAMTELEVKAANFVLDYAKGQLLDNNVRLQPPTRRPNDEYMVIDKQSLRGLEIRTTVRDGHSQGSLLHTIRHTVTKGGARLLANRIVSPLMSLTEIENRLDLVEEFLHNDALREDIRALLRRTADTQRLLQRFSVGRGDADDLLGLADTIKTMNTIVMTLQEHILDPSYALSSEFRISSDCLKDFAARIQLMGPDKLARTILEDIDKESVERRNAVDDEQEELAKDMTKEVIEAEELTEKTPSLVRRAAKSKSSISYSVGADDIWIMRRKASRELGRCHDILDSKLTEARELEQSLQSQSASPSLALKWSSKHGFHCSVKTTKSMTINAIPQARVVAPGKTSTIISVPLWNELGEQIDSTKLHIRREEERVFGKLRAQVIENIVRLRQNASLLNELDVACSSAKIAKEQGYTRPKLNSSTAHDIVGGRHPTVNDSMMNEKGRSFVANDCHVGNPSPIYFITGPNMGGKSTYLRQNALITILAQTGLFVPATHAEIGLVDKVFSRVGSSDNLYRDQSTFMVEMLETAEILKQATPRSFVVMDEIGRGTTPEAGIAVGYACLRHLHTVNRCRTLFATHFHALADMTKNFEGVTYRCTDVSIDEQDGRWMYEHKLKEGVNRNSHALKVAKSAGMPESAIRVAAEVLEGLHNDTSEPDARHECQQASG